MAFLLDRILSELSNVDIEILKIINIHRFAFADSGLQFITNTAYLVSILIPTAYFLLGTYKKRGYLKNIGIQLYVALFTSTILTTIVKHTVNRIRPFVVYKEIVKLSTGGSPSFPSGHTADAFVVLITLLLIGHGKPMLFLIVLFTWACIVAYSRMALGVHYPSDILGSIIIATCSALLVNRYYRKYLAHKTT